MRTFALFLILVFLFSCFGETPGERGKKTLVWLRSVRKEDARKMKKLQKLRGIYKVRGKASKEALKNYTQGIVEYLDYLIDTAPKIRAELAWLETNNIPGKVRLSYYLTGGRNIAERTKNKEKGIWDVRMYKKRKKNFETRLKKNDPISLNAIKNIKYPLN